MLISIIAAMDEKRGIGFKNRIPWHLPGDLQHFKNTTLGHHIIMGRKTFESLGQPLQGRINIIITKNQAYSVVGENVAVKHSLGEALSHAQNHQESEVFITGGASIYEQCLPLAHRLYLTLVHTQTEADTFFPLVDFSNWVELDSRHHPPDKKHLFAYTIKLFKRRVIQE